MFSNHFETGLFQRRAKAHHAGASAARRRIPRSPTHSPFHKYPTGEGALVHRTKVPLGVGNPHPASTAPQVITDHLNLDPVLPGEAERPPQFTGRMVFRDIPGGSDPRLCHLRSSTTVATGFKPPRVRQLSFTLSTGLPKLNSAT
jgi:hypothetical protein